MEKENLKICRFEYDLLRHYLRNGFKYIARDLDGICCVYLQKPIKVSCLFSDILEIWSEDDLNNKHKCESLGSIGDVYFEFIIWEDEEPILIEELIKVYELQERN